MESNRGDQLAIVFALVFPSLVTWAYFVALADDSAGVQQTAYSIGKVLQFAFPAVWVFWVQRQARRASERRDHGLGIGLLFGLAVGAAMLALYHFWLKPTGFFDGPAEAIREKIVSLGLEATWKYLAVGVFYAIFHSLMEEYYWRWFVFRQLTRHTSVPVAIAASSLGFMAHHVILLATYFGWQSPATYLFSLAVAIGGAVWAWIYRRHGTLLAPWLSHCIVDAAIFTIGFDVARSSLQWSVFSGQF